MIQILKKRWSQDFMLMRKLHHTYTVSIKTRITLLVLCSCMFSVILTFSKPIFAWSKEISLGYALPYQESDQVYRYSGFYLNGSFYARSSADHSLLFTLNASAAYWLASSDSNNQLITVAFQPTIRAYFLHNMAHYIRPYLFIAYGPAYLSAKKFGSKEQGKNFAFQGDVGAGIELGRHYKGIDLSFRMIHYSNAGLFKPNQGFEFYVISIGKLF